MRIAMWITTNSSVNGVSTVKHPLWMHGSSQLMIHGWPGTSYATTMTCTSSVLIVEIHLWTHLDQPVPLVRENWRIRRMNPWQAVGRFLRSRVTRTVSDATFNCMLPSVMHAANRFKVLTSMLLARIGIPIALSVLVAKVHSKEVVSLNMGAKHTMKTVTQIFSNLCAEPPSLPRTFPYANSRLSLYFLLLSIVIVRIIVPATPIIMHHIPFLFPGLSC